MLAITNLMLFFGYYLSKKMAVYRVFYGFHLPKNEAYQSEKHRNGALIIAVFLLF